jgi:cytoskeletal protein RodZ
VPDRNPKHQQFPKQTTQKQKGQNMKFKAISAGMVACALAVSLNSCSKSETPAPTEPPKPASTTATEAQPAATAAAAQANQAGQQAAMATTQAMQQATAAAAQPAAAATADAQPLIDKAKSLVNAQKYQDALNTLSQVTNMKLSPDQQKVVDDLKAQIQKLMSNQTVSNAVNSVGNLLGK